MKQSLQLRLGQQLTMTPQLQQAIRLLQLSTLDLNQEIQEALESNLMLEAEDEAMQAESGAGEQDAERDGEAGPGNGQDKDRKQDQELNAGEQEIPDELPLDSAWTDIYDGYGTGSGQKDEADVDFLAFRSTAATLHDHLLWQLNLTPFEPTDWAIATAIIDSINEEGYLTSTLEEIHAALGDETISPEEVEAVLHRIQNFDPPGVAARDPQECLLLQLRQLPPDTPHLPEAKRLCGELFDLLAGRDHAQIKRRLRISDAELAAITKLVRSLNPYPGSQVADAQPQYVVPDVFVVRRKGVWQVELNPEVTPRLRVNPQYAKLIRRADNSDQNTYLKNHLQEARWFIKSLASRNETLLRVARQIVQLQQGFFDHGPEAMRPLVLRDVAEALELHESTISRVTTQKYMHTPRGTLEFKYFFSSHVSTTGGGECSATAIQALIKKLIAAEKADKPLSDNKLAAILSDQGIQVARRTVAKYREAMAIPPSTERKRLL
jgi:RNA polymerase sigma-54 factor